MKILNQKNLKKRKQERKKEGREERNKRGRRNDGSKWMGAAFECVLVR